MDKKPTLRFLIATNGNTYLIVKDPHSISTHGYGQDCVVWLHENNSGKSDSDAILAVFNAASCTSMQTVEIDAEAFCNAIKRIGLT